MKTHILIIGLIIIIIILIVQLHNPNTQEKRIIRNNNPALLGHEVVSIDIVKDWMKTGKEFMTFLAGMINLSLLKKKVKS